MQGFLVNNQHREKRRLLYEGEKKLLHLFLLWVIFYVFHNVPLPVFVFTL